MKIDFKLIIKIALGIFLLYLGIYYWPFISNFITMLFGASVPLLIGCAIAYLINIPMTFFESNFFPSSKKGWIKKARRPISLIAAIITVLAIISLVFGLIVPQLIICVKVIIADIPYATQIVLEWLSEKKLLPDSLEAITEKIDLTSRFGEIAGMLTSGIGNVMDLVVATVTSVFSGIVTAFLSFIFAIYLLCDKTRLRSQFSRIKARYIPQKIGKTVSYVISVLNDSFRKYIIGQCTEAIILGVLCFIGMTLLRLPFAAMISALIAFTALIPVAGAYIGAGVGAFLIIMESPVKALIFIIFIIILQQIEGNIIFPRVVGSSLGLPGIWVLAAVTVGGGVLGVMGMLLGVPIAATVYKLVRNDLNSQKNTANES